MKPYRPSAHRIPELNGLRVLLVFIVSWYHIWQQSWLTPYIGTYSLDYLVRSGYVPVDGTSCCRGSCSSCPMRGPCSWASPCPIPAPSTAAA